MLLILSLPLAGCVQAPADPVARYNIWKAPTPSAGYGCRVAPETTASLQELVRTALAPAGLYEESGDGATELAARLDIGRPKLMEVSRWSTEWRSATDDRRFVELVDSTGSIHIVPATHPSACYARRHAVLLSRSCLTLHAQNGGRRLWYAEIVLNAPEDEPARVAALFQPAVIEVLLANALAHALPP